MDATPNRIAPANDTTITAISCVHGKGERAGLDFGNSRSREKVPAATIASPTRIRIVYHRTWGLQAACRIVLR
jgi:hypothetical protein